MRLSFREIVRAAVITVSLGFANIASAEWLKVIDIDSSDSATNPGYPGNQSSSEVASYLQDLLNLTATPVPLGAQRTYSDGALSGLGNPQTSHTFLLAFHFGNSNNTVEDAGPFTVFYYCQSDCDAFPVSNPRWLGNYRLFSTGQSIGNTPTNSSGTPGAGPRQVPEPATLALFGIGLAGLGFARRK